MAHPLLSPAQRHLLHAHPGRDREPRPALGTEYQAPSRRTSELRLTETGASAAPRTPPPGAGAAAAPPPRSAPRPPRRQPVHLRLHLLRDLPQRVDAGDGREDLEPGRPCPGTPRRPCRGPRPGARSRARCRSDSPAPRSARSAAAGGPARAAPRRGCRRPCGGGNRRSARRHGRARRDWVSDPQVGGHHGRGLFREMRVYQECLRVARTPLCVEMSSLLGVPGGPLPVVGSPIVKPACVVSTQSSATVSRYSPSPKSGPLAIVWLLTVKW